MLTIRSWEDNWRNYLQNGYESFEGYWRKDLRDGEGKYWIKSRNNDNDTAQSTNEDNSKVIKGVWKRDIMKTGIINDIEKIDIGTEASIVSESWQLWYQMINDIAK